MSPDHDQSHLAACIRRHGPRLSPLDADRAAVAAREYAEHYARLYHESAMQTCAGCGDRLVPEDPMCHDCRSADYDE